MEEVDPLLKYNPVNGDPSEPSDSKPAAWKWVLSILLSLVLSGGFALGFVQSNGQWNKLEVLDWIALMTCTVPLLFLEVFLGIPFVMKQFQLWSRKSKAFIFFPTSIIVATYIGFGLFYKRYDPLATIYVIMTCFAILGSMRNISRRHEMDLPREDYWTELLIWLLIWVPLDLRWYYKDYFYGAGFMAYDWWALVVTLFVILGWGVQWPHDEFKFRIVPTGWRDVVVPIGFMVIQAAAIVPLGIWLDFLHFPPKDGYLSPLDGLAVFAENFVTVALTEEVLFRGILMPWFEHVMPSKHGWFGVVCSSLVFGAMHWPRRTGVEARLIYVLLAVIAGVIYALTAKLSRGLFGSALLHALTDTAWAVVLN